LIVFAVVVFFLGGIGWRNQVEAKARGFIRDAEKRARKGQIPQALELYSEAQDRYPDAWIYASEWNTLCWYGSLWGYAPEVMKACEIAVSKDSDNGNIRDSRGLARALTGDLDGAIKDFEFYLNWSTTPVGKHLTDPIDKLWRRRWISALERGQNPFDEATLKVLRNE
jgi:hypothetical protein